MNNFILKELKEGDFFDPLTICLDLPFTQAGFYGEWQKSLGREVKRYIVVDEDKTIAYFQIIKYPLFGNKVYFYIPYGPAIIEFSENLMKFLKRELKKMAKNNNAVFVRLDLTPPVSDCNNKKHLKKIFKLAPTYTYHSAYFQPRAEWFLKLDKSEEDLLKNMNENARYSVRLAGRKGISVEIVRSDFTKYFESFYSLILGTSMRNGFSLHNREYYENIFRNLKPDNSYLSIARFNDQILVIDLIIQYGKVANYVFGGSSNEYRNFMPTYLAIWKAICHAKETGSEFFNFGGISSGNIYKGWDGLSKYKKKFGGFEVLHSSFFDVVSQPVWYRLYNFRKFIKSMLKHN